MDLLITKELPEWNNSKYGNNKKVVVVRFPNCINSTTMKPFRWVPSYQQLEEISEALKNIENESWK